MQSEWDQIDLHLHMKLGAFHISKHVHLNMFSVLTTKKWLS